jgi:hypothetical protein
VFLKRCHVPFSHLKKSHIYIHRHVTCLELEYVIGRMNIKLFLLLILVGCAGGKPQSQELSSDCTDRFCGQMTTCTEAMHELLSCGRKELDGDNDGIPCEELCVNYD